MPEYAFDTVSIASGQDASPALNTGDVDGLYVFAPAALTGTVTVEVSHDGTAWVTLQSEGSDVQVPAGKATAVGWLRAPFTRLKSSASEAAPRDFEIRATRFR